jgi:hypothetical protein
LKIAGIIFIGSTTLEFDDDLLCLMPLPAISWRPVLVVEEAGVLIL